jgi:hypothetical protein
LFLLIRIMKDSVPSSAPIRILPMFLSGIINGRDKLKDLHVDERVILKFILKK